MGGEVGVDSLQGEGSVFWFSMDIAEDLDATAESERYDHSTALICMPDSKERLLVSRTLSELGISFQLIDDVDPLELSGGLANADLVLIDEGLPTNIQNRLSGLLDASPHQNCFLLSGQGSLNRRSLMHRFHARCLHKPIVHDDILSCLREVSSAEAPNIRSSDEPEKTNQKVGENLRILLAEDHVVNQKIVTKILVKAGYSVDVAGDGGSAIEMLDQVKYDLILMDFQMPHVDGLTATRSIRETEFRNKAARIPIIAMTANAMKDDRALCLDAGMDDYTAKPVRHRELLRLIERWAPARTH
jgi:CheY-like chemotaxis protein